MKIIRNWCSANVNLNFQSLLRCTVLFTSNATAERTIFSLFWPMTKQILWLTAENQQHLPGAKFRLSFFALLPDCLINTSRLKPTICFAIILKILCERMLYNWISSYLDVFPKITDLKKNLIYKCVKCQGSIQCGLTFFK